MDECKPLAYGADTLRLWVASTDYTSDVLIGGAPRLAALNPKPQALNPKP